MERLVKKVAKLREKTRHYGEEINRMQGTMPDITELPSGCFGMVFNDLTLTLELLAYYHSLWSRPYVNVAAEERKRLIKENAERCISILKWLFIASLSSIEYSTKVSVASYGEDSPAKDLIKVKREQRIYLSDIVRNSKNASLINDDEYVDWQNLIFIRNCVVHNNAVSDCDKTLDIAGTRVVASEGKMLQGKLDCFAVFTEVAIERYFTWVKALIRKYGN